MLLEKMVIKNFLKYYPVGLFGESFKIVFNDKLNEEIKIGEKDPEFIIIINKPLDKKKFLKTPSIIIGEAYMDKAIDG